jgi:hypothetical protein
MIAFEKRLKGEPDVLVHMPDLICALEDLVFYRTILRERLGLGGIPANVTAGEWLDAVIGRAEHLQEAGLRIDDMSESALALEGPSS